LATDDKISRVLLQYVVDKNSLTQAQLASAKVRGDMQSIANAAKQTELATVKAGASIRDSFGSAGSSRIRSLVGETESATRQMNRLKESVTGVQQEIKSLSNIKAADIIDPELGDVVGGGGGFNRAGITRIGAKIRNLPSTQIPGLPIATDAIGNILRLIGGLPTPVLAAAGAFAAVAASVGILNASLAGSKAALDAATKANTTYYDLIRNKTTSGELQQQISDLSAAQAADLAELQSITAAFASGFKSTSDVIGNAGAKFLFAAGQVSDADDALTARADTLRKSLNDGRATIDVLLNAQDSAAIAANDLAAATAAATKAEQELLAARAANAIALDNSRINAQIQAANLSVNGTEKQVQELIDGYNRQKKVLLDNLPILQAQLAATEAGTDANKAYQNELNNVTLRLADLDTNINTLAGDTLKAAQANDLAAEAEKKRVDSIKAVESYNADIARINETAAQKEIDLATKYADKQVEIAAKAAEDAAKLLENLENKLASLATDVGRDLDKDTRKANFDALQEQVEFQRDEANETKRHYQDLDRIRRQARAAEFEQGLDRDFAGLARSRRATAEQINESNIQFNEDRQARLDSFAVKRQDESAEFAFERQERIIQFEQDVADARAQYARERLQLADAKNKQLTQAKAAYDKELALAQSKHRAELAAKDAAIRSELQIIQAGNTARLQLEQQLQQQYLTILRNSMSAIGGSLSSGAGNGANLGGGTGGGSANGGGTVGGIGGIFGFGAGAQKTSSTNNSMSLSVPIQITTGGSPEQLRAIAPAIGNIIETKLTEYHRSIYGGNK
jgi:hypothetical protein